MSSLSEYLGFAIQVVYLPVLLFTVFAAAAEAQRWSVSRHRAKMAPLIAKYDQHIEEIDRLGTQTKTSEVEAAIASDRSIR